jgi:lipoprotein NlpI
MRNLFATTLLLSGIFSPLGNSAPPSAPPNPAAAASETVVEEFKTDLSQLNQALLKNPNALSLLSRRGDCHLFLGHFPEAIADFESMIATDPQLDAGHWRLGIAYHFAGRHTEAAHQFAKYHAYDGRDRENGIWKLLSDARVSGLSAARKEMLTYPEFDREPFPSLYEMFAGKRTSMEVLADLEQRGLLRKPLVGFFAHYYCGLNEGLLGNPSRAQELLDKAVSTFSHSAIKTGGPGYMWQVARLHAAGAGTPLVPALP